MYIILYIIMRALAKQSLISCKDLTARGCHDHDRDGDGGGDGVTDRSQSVMIIFRR